MERGGGPGGAAPGADKRVSEIADLYKKAMELAEDKVNELEMEGVVEQKLAAKAKLEEDFAVALFHQLLRSCSEHGSGGREDGS